MSWKNVRLHIAPAYLLACLLLGGSGQSVWLNASLEFAAVMILGWAMIEGPALPVSREAKQVALLFAVLLGLVMLQLIPLPPVIWQALPGRGMVTAGLRLLSLQPGWQPLSLSPYDSFSSALTLLPPLAMLAAIIILRAFTRTGLAVAVLIGTTLGLILGVLQVSGSDTATSRFYLQPEYDIGAASGFFANPDHMATLLVLSLPFLAALVASGLAQASHSRRTAAVILGVVGVFSIVVGIVRNGSLAGLGLAMPVLLFSGLLVLKFSKRAAKTILGAAFLGMILCIALVATPLNRVLTSKHASVALSTRQEFFWTGVKVAGDYFPVGSGVGTFPRVYRIKEDPRNIDPTTFVNHAHDDYLEILIETGLPGVLLVVAFLVWWLRTTMRLIGMPPFDRFALAGAIGAATILVHSIVDFPLRTSAIAASLAMCIALMAIPKIRVSHDKDLRPTRHVVIH